MASHAPCPACGNTFRRHGYDLLARRVQTSCVCRIISYLDSDLTPVAGGDGLCGVCHEVQRPTLIKLRLDEGLTMALVCPCRVDADAGTLRGDINLVALDPTARWEVANA